MSELIRFKCDCGRELKAPSTATGRRAKCPKCQAVVVVPGAKAVSLRPGQKADAPSPAADALAEAERLASEQAAEVQRQQARAKQAAASKSPLEVARDAFDSGSDRKARQALDELLASDPHHGEGLFLSAQLYERAMDVERAVDAYMKAASAGVEEAREQGRELVRESMVDESRRMLKSGNHGRALELIDKALRVVPGLREATIVRLEALIAGGQVDAAWPGIKALSADPAQAAEANRLKQLINSADPAKMANLNKQQLQSDLSELRVRMTHDPNGAAEALGSLSEANPDDSVVMDTWGKALELARKPAEALEVYRKTLAKDPSDVGLVHRCLALMQEMADPSAFASWLDEMIDEAGHRTGETLAARVKLRGAEGGPGLIADLQALIELQSGDPALVSQLVDAQRKAGQLDEALATLETALVRLPNHRELHVAHANLLYEQDDVVGVVNKLVEIGERFGETRDQLEKLAGAQHALERTEDAARTLARSLSVAPPPPVGRYADIAERLHGWGQAEIAGEALLARLERDDADREAGLEVGRKLQSWGLAEASDKALSWTLERFGDAALYDSVAEWQRKWGQADAAAATESAGLDRFAEGGGAYARRADARRLAGDLTGARRLLDAGVARFGQDRQLAFALVEIQAAQGDADSALATCRGLLAEEPTPRLYTRVAQLCISIGDRQGAATLLGEGAERFPDDDALRFNQANVLFEGGDYEQAIQVYTAVLERHPGDRQALINRAACYRLGTPRRHALAIADLERALRAPRAG